MANPFESSSFRTTRFDTAIWAAKLLLLAIGIISTYIFFKVAIIPYTIDLSLSTLPRLWISLRSWLSPPYIYIIVNFIIITIATSSAFQHQNHPPFSLPTIAKPTTHKSQPQPQDQTSSFKDLTSDAVPTTNSIHDDFHDIIWDEIVQLEHEKERVEHFVSSDPSPESSSENSCLTEAGRKDGDDDESTLDATWNAIMEAQGKPLKRQLKKSETWDLPPRLERFGAILNDGDIAVHGDDEDDPVGWARREMKKSDTFNDRVSLVMMRKKSMSQEELNSRAEAFIKKFNAEMRLQRLESDQRFMEMVNRGI
ncbi:uncharacterized protein LOC121248101 [Juglans microcarpa x Juglans regia]|uniref:uncharacterized protein LOC121248101 n=1 Tax=Juglans microcarpa x Juglans regia TaxID=2249226 RepID=UPI001B7E4C13|nr:uncharacterized protein LOC121248101 [Juglans microcarpa x Juglans regia]